MAQRISVETKQKIAALYAEGHSHKIEHSEA